MVVVTDTRKGTLSHAMVLPTKRRKGVSESVRKGRRELVSE